MDEQRQDNQLEPTYSSSVPIWYVALKTCQKQWAIEKGGEKGSGISVLMARYDNVYIYISCIVVSKEFFAQLNDIQYFYLIQIICTQLYGFKYSDLILIITWFQIIISIQ